MAVVVPGAGRGSGEGRVLAGSSLRSESNSTRLNGGLTLTAVPQNLIFSARPVKADAALPTFR